MNIWRMKLRVGSHGPDMFPQCLQREIVSYTHGPILEADFTRLHKSDVDPGVKGSARPSIFYFAWEIKGGDVVYIGDSEKQRIIARGVVAGEVGVRAYHFNSGNAIREPRPPHTFWRHEIPVKWDTDFKEFPYKDPAPQNSVYRLKARHLRDWGIKQPEDSPESPSAEAGLLNELDYQRQTPETRLTISRLHTRLSNCFRQWLNNEYGIRAVQESENRDLVFNAHGQLHLAELKICYGADTRHAIREAIGQVLEYNHYPEREVLDRWWVVLDCEPSREDRLFVQRLRDLYGLAFLIAWECEGSFRTVTPNPL